MITFYGILWLAGGNDIIAYHFHIDLYTTTWIARIAIFAGPVIAYRVTKGICLGLQRKDVALLEHGAETGIIRQLPNGEFTELTRPYPRTCGPCFKPGPSYSNWSHPAPALANPAMPTASRPPLPGPASAGYGWRSTESSPKASRCPTLAQTLMATAKPTSSQRQLLMRTPRRIPRCPP